MPTRKTKNEPTQKKKATMMEKVAKRKTRSTRRVKSGQHPLIARCFDLFIPQAGNAHQPRALRPKSIVYFAAVMVGLKIIVSLILLLSYPEPARVQEDMRNSLSVLINNARKESGVSLLRINDELMRAAQAKADDMLARGYFDHYTPDGLPPSSFINTKAYTNRLLGENLAIDFATPVSAHRALLNSPSHRANMLYPKFEDMGVGVASGQFQGRETNIAVELFSSTERPQRVLGAMTGAMFMSEIKSLIWSWGSAAHQWSKRVYLAAFVYLALMLLCNVMIQIRVQHAAVIIPGLLGMVLILMLLMIEIPVPGSAVSNMVKIL